MFDEFKRARAKREKQNKNLKCLISFFVFRHLFCLCFSTNKMPEKLTNILGQIKNIFVEKKDFLFNFFVLPSAFPVARHLIKFN